MKVKKFYFGPAPRGYNVMPFTNQMEIRVEIDGVEYGYSSHFSDFIPYSEVKRVAFRCLGDEIARKLEAQI